MMAKGQRLSSDPLRKNRIQLRSRHSPRSVGSGWPLSLLLFLRPPGLGRSRRCEWVCFPTRACASVPPRVPTRLARMSSKKKFTIKPFWPNHQMDAKAADKSWGVLRSAITEIHKHNASSLSFEELYRTAYNMVLHKHGEKLYQGVSSILQEHLRGLGQGVADSQDSTLLKELQLTWEDHQVTMVMIRDILMYMDRTFVVHSRRVPVYDMGLKIFREGIVRHTLVKDRLRTILLNNIEAERTGEVGTPRGGGTAGTPSTPGAPGSRCCCSCCYCRAPALARPPLTHTVPYTPPPPPPHPPPR